MSINTAGVHRRSANTAETDAEQLVRNLQAESWKVWPNEAGFQGLEEHRGPIEFAVKGQIPSWVAGTLYRTGPSQFSVDTEKRGRFEVSHWFDGFAHSHKFEIIPASDGRGPVRVEYTSRRQSEQFVEGIRKRGWQNSMSFAQRADPCIGIFAKMQSAFSPAPPLNNCVAMDRNAHVPGSKSVPSSGTGPETESLYLTTDSCILQEIDPNTLEPIRYTNQKALNPNLKGPLGAAHAQRDPNTGDLFNYNLYLGPVPTYRIYRTDASTGETSVIATIKNAAPAYIHSMFLTENYVVLCVPGSHFAWKGIKIPMKGNLAEALAPFDSSGKMDWFVVDRSGAKGVVARFDTPAGFFFHSVNAFEEPVKEEKGANAVDLTFDLITYRNLDLIQSAYMDVILDRNGATKKYWQGSLKRGGHGTCLTRFRYRIVAPSQRGTVNKPGATAEKVFSIPAPHHGELPTINPRFSTRRHRYVYGVITRGLSTVFDCLVKTDTVTKEALIWAPEQGHTPGEAIFVPRPPSGDANLGGETEQDQDEDDGVILSVVLDGLAKNSYLVCLDAKTLEELGRAECDFPIAVGLHGSYAQKLV